MASPAMGSTAAIDSSLLTVPLASLRRAAKDTKSIFDEANAAIADIAQVADLAKEQQLQSLDSLVVQLQGLKRKLGDVSKTEKEDAHRCKARLEHLNSLGPAPENGTVAWNQLRLDRILVDHLLRCGYHSSAVKLATESNIMDLVDIHIFLGARRVVEALQSHNCSAALEWCAVNQARLKKIKSNLEFKLRAQEFIELVRAERKSDAIMYARQHLAQWAGVYMQDLQQVLATLAFTKSTSCEPYQSLFAPSQWGTLQDLFFRDLYRLHALPPESLLTVHLQAGLAGLKTAPTYMPTPPPPGQGQGSKEDPLHLPSFQKLAEGLPFSKHTKSKLVCYVTRELISDANPAMVLPNGYVYSKRGTDLLAARNGGRVVCPITGKVCGVDELRRAFVVS